MSNTVKPQLRQQEHRHGLYDEFICHFPYSVLSVALGLVVLTLVTTLATVANPHKAYFALFHNFHYLHIIFAGAGTVLTFFKYSRSVIKGIIVGTISPAVFCILSDVIMPYIGGRLAGVPMKLHICFLHEYTNIGIFLLVGIITGFVLSLHSQHNDQTAAFARWSHFLHIFLSSLASMFYMVASGFVDWMPRVGVVSIILIAAVVIPCTLSDVIVPVWFARTGNE